MRTPHSEKTKLKLSEIAKINQNKPEVKERQRIARNKPGARERKIEIARISQNRPEVKAKKSASIKESWKKPEVRERRRIASNRPEVKAKKSASAKRSWGRPEVREKSLITLNKPEVKARRIEVQKEAQNRPEVKSKKSASIKESWKKPEVREKHCIAALKFINRPEVREKMCEVQMGGFWYGSVTYNDRKQYCECWNPGLWRRIDVCQDNKSIISGKTKEDNGGRALSRHHVYWQEKACCVWDGDKNGYYAMINLGTKSKPDMHKYYINGSPNKFVLLTSSEHRIIAGNKKLGTNKLTWIKILEDLIETKLGGKCYYTKKEYSKLSLGGRFTGEGRKVGHGKLTDEQIDIVKKATGFEPDINLF